MPSVGIMLIERVTRSQQILVAKHYAKKRHKTAAINVVNNKQMYYSQQSRRFYYGFLNSRNT